MKTRTRAASRGSNLIRRSQGRGRLRHGERTRTLVLFRNCVAGILLLVLAGCTQAHLNPGDSIDTAYKAGADYIELAPGTYSGQQLSRVVGHRDTLVVCKAGAKVAGLAVYASGVWLDGCDFDGQVYLEDAHRIRFHGDDFGPRANGAPLYIQGGQGRQSGPIEIRDSTFHDATATGDAHTECVWVGSVAGLTVTGSSFVRCTYIDVFFTDCCDDNGSAGTSGVTSAVVLRDNTLCEPTTGPAGQGFYSVQTHPILRWRDVNISGNRLGAPVFNQAASSTNVAIGPNETVDC